MKEAYESVRKTNMVRKMIEKMSIPIDTIYLEDRGKVMEYTCYDPPNTFLLKPDFKSHAACQYQGKGKACKLTTPTPLSVVIAHENGTHVMGENDDGPDI